MIEVEPDLDVSQEWTLSERLDETPPGPELARLLASVDRTGLDSDDLLRLAAARQRLIAHHEAQMLAELHAIARMVPKGDPLPRGVTRQQGKYPWAEVEAAFALRWTHTRAASQMILADEVIDRLPVVYTALAAGDIDMPKARVITELLACVDDPVAVAVAGTVIEQARQQTTAQLRDRLRRLLVAADPTLAAKKARRAIAQRRVAVYTDDDTHLASLAGHELAAHRVAAVMERLDAIARASKGAGDPRGMDQLRADAFLDLLAGQGVAIGGQISHGDLGVAPTGGDPTGQDPQAADAGPVPWPDEPPEAELADAGPQAQLAAVRHDPGQPADLWAPGFGAPPPGHLRWDEPDHDHADQLQRDRWLADFDRLPVTAPATRCGLCGHLSGQPPTPGPLPGPRTGVVEITTSLETLLGLADLPAELTGYGPVAADIARQVIASMHHDTWRFAIHDPMCRLVHHGTTGARPTPPSHRQEHRTPRRPSPSLAAFIKARDRTCVAVGCRRPARRCDIDHTLDWVKGGETVHCNLNLLCRLHHLFKHATGCELVQLSPGVFIWNTPAGLQHLTRSDRPRIGVNELAGLTPPGKPLNPDAAVLDTAQLQTTPEPATPLPRQSRVSRLFAPDEPDRTRS